MNEILQQRIKEAAKNICCADCPFENIRVCKTTCVEPQNAVNVATFALQNQWISVEETLPQKDDLYFVLIDGLHPRVTEFENGKWQGYSNITNWMEIPKNK